ncbi:MAG: AtpZ/AtpI family protein [Ginsengibacter sp.]
MTNNNEGNKQLLRYSGLAMQFLAGIGIGVFIGLKADKWLNFSIPLLVWLLPLLILCGIIYKIIKDTSAKK